MEQILMSYVYPPYKKEDGLLRNANKGQWTYFRNGGREKIKNIQTRQNFVEIKFEGYDNNIDWSGAVDGRWSTKDIKTFQDIVGVK